jgi:hypothetical protein
MSEEGKVAKQREGKGTPGALAAAKLASSGLDTKDAKLLGIEVLTIKEVKLVLAKNKGVPDMPGLKIQYHNLAGEPRRGVCCVRLLGEYPVEGFADLSKDGQKRYIRPVGCPPAAYFPRLVNWEKVAKDTSVPIVVTEGELKSACAAKRGHACFALPGVDSFSSSKRGWALLPELKEMKWLGRQVYLVFDADAARKPAVMRAMVRFTNTITQEGATTAVVNLPDLPDVEKTGLDDFLVAEGDEEFQRLLDDAVPDDLARKLWEFNSRFVMIKHPGFVIDERAVEELHDPTQKRWRNTPQMALSDFKNVHYSNVWAKKIVSVEEDGRPKLQDVKVAFEWADWPMRREHSFATYAPGQPRIVGDCYNTWGGWGVEEEKGDVGPWTDLLDRVFDGSPEMRRWGEKWFAWPIAHPEAGKLNTSLCIWSHGQGVGKSVIGKTLGLIYGNNYSEINQNDLESDFNWWAIGKQFVMIDDMTGSDAQRKVDILKKLITEEFLQCNVKHVPQYPLPDHANFYETSNRPNVLRVDEGDRRFAIHQILKAICGRDFHMTQAEVDRCRECGPFWRRYYEWLAGGGPSHLLWHFRHEVNLDAFEPTGWAPMTESKEEMIGATRSEAAQFLAALREDPDSVLWGANGALTRDIYTSSEVVTFFDRVRKKEPVTVNAMGVLLQQMRFPRASAVPLKVFGRTWKGYVIRVKNAQKWNAAGRDGVQKHVEDELRKEGFAPEEPPKKRAKKF